MAAKLKFPAPYFGGKSKIANIVWSRLGDCDNYIEPFCGSAAVLLARPHLPRVETLNDKDCMIANVFRALKHDPEGVAEYADWHVNEADLHSRHRWLVGIETPSPWTDTPYLHAMAGPSKLVAERREFRRRMRVEPDYYEAKIAGWWLWGSCCWIGGGFCVDPEHGAVNGPVGGSGERSPLIGGNGHGPIVHGVLRSGKAAQKPGGPVVSAEWQQCPQLEDSGGRGVLGSGKGALHERRPHQGGGYDGSGIPGVGIHTGKIPDLSGGNRPQLADAYSRGRGVHNDNHLSQQRPRNTGPDAGGQTGVHANEFAAGTCAQRRAWLLDWFGRLRDRLRTVRVCAGSWLRVCDSESVTTRLGLTGLFMDPPYPSHRADGSESRSDSLYATDGDRNVLDVLRDEVLAYCLERGSHPKMRIVVAAYDTDGYNVLLEHGWTVESWTSQGGYSNRNKSNKNRTRERLYFSPNCLKGPAGLFDALEEPERAQVCEDDGEVEP